MANSVLVIDDQASILHSMEVFFQLREWEVYTAINGRNGLALAKKLQPTLVVLDIRLPDIDGLDVLKELRCLVPETEVIMITAHQDMESTIQAIKLGAFDYLHKPVDIDEMDSVLKRLLAVQAASTFIPVDVAPKSPKFALGKFHVVGKSMAMKEVFKKIALASGSRATVLVQGESGTGKDMVAQAIHKNSPWSSKPFTVMDCSTLVQSLVESELFGHEKGAFTGADRARAGRIELTGDGTVFFDEIGELPLHLQSRLLRFLQEGQFVRVGGGAPIQSNARIIAATNRDLRAMVTEGKFREDLFFRLQVVTIYMPPLRDRLSDIPALAQFLLEKIAVRSALLPRTLSNGAISELMKHDWPGNVRELENALTRASLMSKSTVLSEEDIVTALEGIDRSLLLPRTRSNEAIGEQMKQDWPGNVRELENTLPHASLIPNSTLLSEEDIVTTLTGIHLKKKFVQTLAEAERDHILYVLESCDWNLGNTCQALGTTRPTLRAKIREYGLEKPKRT